MVVKLIAHVLLSFENQFLIIKRSSIKLGQPNVYPNFWDVPGGSVEEGELPRAAAIRECYEETGIDIFKQDLQIIHEDSQFDQEKQTVFTRLVYHCHLDKKPGFVRLDPEEHVAYAWSGERELETKLLVPYLKEILEKRKQ